VPTRPQLEEFFARIDPVRGRLIFALDATGSRQATWATAIKLQAEMFNSVAAIGGLDLQLVYYQGWGKCVASRWLSDAKALGAIMSEISCSAGPTQIERVLRHASKEHQRQPINALVLVSDACEEIPADLYDTASGLRVPAFLFQEGSDDHVAGIYAEIARITGGGVARFDSGAAQRLSDLLKAVAAFAVGGVKALAAQKTEAATLLLSQIRK
jgi:hypothetical protein